MGTGIVTYRKTMKAVNLKKLFGNLEKEFDMEHACPCKEWCDCWDKFKEKWVSKQKIQKNNEE